MRYAILYAQLELEPSITALKRLQAQDVIGTSGTARAIANVLRENEWSETGITRTGLQKLVQRIIKTGKTSKLKIKGLSNERRPVFAGGSGDDGDFQLAGTRIHARLRRFPARGRVARPHRP